jgi:hypothetical protein
MLAESIRQTRPALYADPRLRTVLAAEARRRGLRPEASHLYELLASSRSLGVWSQCGRGELWQLNQAGPPPKSVADCLPTGKKPRLDAQLDEEFWQQAKPIPLASPWGDDAQWPAVVRLAHDHQYLYLAIECRNAHGAEYPIADHPRSRDADLSGSDRLELLLDVDRDCASFYRLAVDSRGWTADECQGQPRWDPEWFVASSADDQQWTVEAAIHFRDLVPEPPRRGDIWSVGLQRVVPNVGFQSWTQPSGIEPRAESFGYLQFQ